MSLGDISKFSEKFKEIQEILTKANIDVVSRSGHIRIIMNGQQQVLAIRINPAVLKVPYLTHIEQELKAIFNEAQKRSKEKALQEIERITGIKMDAYKGMF